MKVTKVKISNLKSHPENPNTHPDNQLKELQNSLDQFEQVKNIVVWQGKVIAGNGLMEAARLQNRTEIEVQDVSDWPEEKAISFMIADNRLQELAVMDNNILSGLITNIDEPFNIPGVDADYLDSIDFGADVSEEKKDTDNVETMEIDEVIQSKIDKADNIIYQFSGGRDSTLAILKTIELVRDKNPLAVYVDTGSEFPDLLYFIYNFCNEHDLRLQVLHPKKNFFEIYGEKKQFPDTVFRDCISRLINNPVNDFYLSTENPLIIRGGRSKQKTSRSKSNVYQEISKGKKTIKLLNPLYSLSNDEYDSDISKVSVWPGYSNGFIRTACWCCPFQREPQWEALRINYPLLWSAMFDLYKSWTFKKIKGDGCIKQYKKYWDKQ